MDVLKRYIMENKKTLSSKEFVANFRVGLVFDAMLIAFFTFLLAAWCLDKGDTILGYVNVGIGGMWGAIAYSRRRRWKELEASVEKVHLLETEEE